MSATPIQTEVLIIGAGPVGLFQVFQLGLHEISAHVIDAHTQIGGQCSALYPDKFIYDIPGIPRITAQQLVDQLHTQIAPFHTPIHLGECVRSLKVVANGFEVTTNTGTLYSARCVVIAAGVGAFVHKELPLAELKPIRNKQTQVFHTLPDAVELEDKEIVIYGANENAVNVAIKASNHPSSQGRVTLIYRRDKLDIDDSVQDQLDKTLKTGHLKFKVAQITSIQERKGVLTHLMLTDSQGEQTLINCDYLIESLGLSPKLGPLLEWELQMERKALIVSPETFSTSITGIYAVGDINTYPGKRKLLLSGFHEATLAANAVAAKLTGQVSTPLEYTSASTRIHKLLGVGRGV